MFGFHEKRCDKEMLAELSVISMHVSLLVRKEDAALQIRYGSESRAGHACPGAVGRVRVVLNTERNGP